MSGTGEPNAAGSELLKIILDQAPLEVCAFDPEGRLTAASAAWKRATGLNDRIAEGLHLDALHLVNVQDFKALLGETRKGRASRLRHWTAIPWPQRNGRFGAVIVGGVAHGVSAVGESAAPMSFDQLTGALTRDSFMALLEKKLDPDAAPGRSVAVAMANIDRMERINASFGESVGDRALAIFAEVARSALRENDFVGRLDGDLFGVFLDDVDIAAAERVCNRVREAFLQRGVRHRLEEVAVSVSVGVAAGPIGRVGAEAIVAAAKRALGNAKVGGRNRVAVSVDRL